MQQFCALLALASLLATACSSERDTDRPIIDLGDTADALGRDFKVEATELIYPNKLGFRGTLSIVKAAGPEEGQNEVRGAIYLLDVPLKGTVRIQADEHGLYDEATKDMEFVLLREAGNNVWQRIELFFERQNDEGGNELYNPNSLDELVWTPNLSNQEDARAIAETDEFNEITVEGEFGLENVGERIGIFVIPRSVWGGIRGDYDFELNLDCSGRLCRSPETEAELSEQDNEDDTEPGDPEQPQNGGEPRTDKSFDGENPSYTDDIMGGGR